MRVGDRILSCDGVPVKRIRDVLNRMGISPGQRITFEVERAGSDLSGDGGGSGAGGELDSTSGRRKLLLVSEKEI